MHFAVFGIFPGRQIRPSFRLQKMPSTINGLLKLLAYQMLAIRWNHIIKTALHRCTVATSVLVEFDQPLQQILPLNPDRCVGVDPPGPPGSTFTWCGASIDVLAQKSSCCSAFPAAEPNAHATRIRTLRSGMLHFFARADRRSTSARLYFGTIAAQFFLTRSAEAEDPTKVNVSSTMEWLQTLWCALLGRDSVTPEEDFFELGGNPLLLMEMHARVRSRFTSVPPITEMSLFATPRALAERLTSGQNGPGEQKETRKPGPNRTTGFTHRLTYRVRPRHRTSVFGLA